MNGLPSATGGKSRDFAAGRISRKSIAWSVLRVALPFEQRALPVFSPPIPTHSAVAPNHAMAWDEHREMIRGARAGDRPNRTRPPDALRHLGVGPGFSLWNPASRHARPGPETQSLECPTVTRDPLRLRR